jgi:threonine/homoserine/homoserine lactone efflux protein
VGPSFLAGLLAGYGVAIPVGAIAILIVDLAIRRGFRVAAAAGAGAATADFVYATLATMGGAAAAAILEPWARPLRIVAVGALLGIGLRGLVALLLSRGSGAAEAGVTMGVRGTYARFVGLTVLNPTTVVYFAALILALPQLASGPAARLAFIAGAFLASLSWQTVLAGVGAVAHHRLPARFQAGLTLVGSLAICAFAVALLRDLPA